MLCFNYDIDTSVHVHTSCMLNEVASYRNTPLAFTGVLKNDPFTFTNIGESLHGKVLNATTTIFYVFIYFQ